jgi:hypothetical protein
MTICILKKYLTTAADRHSIFLLLVPMLRSTSGRRPVGVGIPYSAPVVAHLRRAGFFFGRLLCYIPCAPTGRTASSFLIGHCSLNINIGCSLQHSTVLLFFIHLFPSTFNIPCSLFDIHYSGRWSGDQRRQCAGVKSKSGRETAIESLIFDLNCKTHVKFTWLFRSAFYIPLFYILYSRLFKLSIEY